jgi:hypothetical protein
MKEKVLIIAEMTLLFGGSIAISKANRPQQSWADVLVTVAPRRALATSLLLALLLLTADLGYGNIGAWFGLAIIASMLLAYGGKFAFQLEQLTERI